VLPALIVLVARIPAGEKLFAELNVFVSSHFFRRSSVPYLNV